MSVGRKSAVLKILKFKNFSIEGRKIRAPTKVQICGREYDVSFPFGDDHPVGDIHGVPIRDLFSMQLRDIPEWVAIHCENTDLGCIVIMRFLAVLKIRDRVKDWKLAVPIKDYYKLMKSVVLAYGFDLINYIEGEDEYLIEFSQDFGLGTSVIDVYETFTKFMAHFFKEIKRLGGGR